MNNNLSQALKSGSVIFIVVTLLQWILINLFVAPLAAIIKILLQTLLPDAILPNKIKKNPKVDISHLEWVKKEPEYINLMNMIHHGIVNDGPTGKQLENKLNLK